MANITAACFVEINPRTDTRAPHRRLSAAELQTLRAEYAAGRAEVLDELLGWAPYTHTVKAVVDGTWGDSSTLHARIED